MHKLIIDNHQPLDADWYGKLLDALKGVREGFVMLEPDQDQMNTEWSKFYDSNCHTNPNLRPRWLDDKQLLQAEQRLKTLQNEITSTESNTTIREAYRGTIQDYIRNIGMARAVVARDHDAFMDLNGQMYGMPDADIFAAVCAWIRQDATAKSGDDDAVVQVAAEISEQIPDLQGKASLLFPDEETFKKVRSLHFIPGGYFDQLLAPGGVPKVPFVDQDYGDAIVRRVISNVGSDFTVAESAAGLWAVLQSTRHVILPKRYTLTPQSFTGIIAHELGSHLVESVNGSHSSLRLLELGLEGYEKGNEGRAFLREQIVFDRPEDYTEQSSWYPTKASWEYRITIYAVICLAMGLAGRVYDFAEIYKIVQSLFTFWTLKRGQVIEQKVIDAGAWSMVTRALKGTTGNGGAYLKDIVYLQGNIRCWQVAKEQPEFIMYGDYGKFDITNRRHVMMLKELGILPS